MRPEPSGQSAMTEPVYYHGTRRGFTRNGYVTPRTFSKSDGTTAPLKKGHVAPLDSAGFVYVTTDLTLAWVYAWHAPGRGKPKVLIVKPQGDVYRDPEHSPDMEAYRIAGWAKVLDVMRQPLISEEDARAGWVDA